MTNEIHAHFTCALCYNTFQKLWSDEEANTEFLSRFGYMPEEDRATVCDDCYQRVMGKQ